MEATQGALLGTFQRHIEEMRALVHCKICLKPFYEPFTLSCGHTYCYSCISSWIGGGENRHTNKNCPDCRTVIRSEPCPNYTLRDLVHMFCNRVELLPEEETLEEHETGKAEEARVLASDRSGRGLFKGVFSRYAGPGQRLGPLGRPQFLRDDEDGGIDRCPNCLHEVLHGVCTNGGCGIDFNDSESDYLDASAPPSPGTHWNPAQHSGNWFDDLRSDASDVTDRSSRPPYVSLSEDDEDNSEMDDFIDDDDEHDYPEERDDEEHYANAWASSSPFHARPRLVSRAGRVRSPSVSNVSHLDSETDYSEAAEPFHYNHFSGDHIDTDTDGYESEQASPTPRRVSTYPIDYDSEASADQPHQYHDALEGSDREQQTNYDSDESSIREISPPVLSQSMRNRQRRVIDSDDEDEEQSVRESETAQFSDDEEDDDSVRVVEADKDSDAEDSDDTAIRPPQTSSLRRQRLNVHRARRGTRSSQYSDRASSSVEPESLFGNHAGMSSRQRGRAVQPVIDPTGYAGRRATSTRVF